MKVKYPRTMHLPNSPGRGHDDKVLTTVEHFVGKKVVILEKMDGENTTIYPDGTCHARSLDSKNHPSRNWVKGFASGIGPGLGKGLRLCGENMYGQHSIQNNNLESFFYGFSIWDEDSCYSWDTTLEWFENLGVTPVRELYRGPFDMRVIEELAKSINTKEVEGFVLRVADGFKYDDFSKSVAKWVRPGHVQSDEHWTKNWVPNKLRSDNE